MCVCEESEVRVCVWESACVCVIVCVCESVYVCVWGGECVCMCECVCESAKWGGGRRGKKGGGCDGESPQEE